MSGQTIILASDRQRELAHRLIERAPPRAVLTIREEARTPDQNAKLWAMLSDIARARPAGRNHTTDQWKGIFMAACDHKPVFVPDLDGQGFVCLGYKSSRLNKAQFSDLIECIYAYGAEHHVTWSEPNPYEQEVRAA